MKVIRKGSGRRDIKNPVLTLGNFDGLHLGHMKIIRKVVERARSLKRPSVVYTFDPHPLKVVAPHKSPPLILDAKDKRAFIESSGIDYLVLAKFTREFAAKHPGEFVEETLVRCLSVREVWVGHDFSFGRGKSGTVEYLKELGNELGFRVFVVPAYKKGGVIVSSSKIRALISEGRVEGAARLLGRMYAIKGRVVKGREIGKSIGFPTANLEVASELIPRNGVYAAYAVIGGRRYPAVLNIGVSPTFGAKERTVEVHVFGFKKDIYGKPLEVVFVRRLRSEKAFASKDALVRQINRDIGRAKKILGADSGI